MMAFNAPPPCTQPNQQILAGKILMVTGIMFCD